MVFTPVIITSVAKYVPGASWGVVPYGWLTEKEKTRAWFTNGSSHCAGPTQKWTAAALQPFSGTTLKGTGEGKSSQWAELWELHKDIQLVWKESCPDI